MGVHRRLKKSGKPRQSKRVLFYLKIHIIIVKQQDLEIHVNSKVTLTIKFCGVTLSVEDKGPHTEWCIDNRIEFMNLHGWLECQGAFLLGMLIILHYWPRTRWLWMKFVYCKRPLRMLWGFDTSLFSIILYCLLYFY